MAQDLCRTEEPPRPARADLAEEFAAVQAQTPAGPHRPAEDLVQESRDKR